MSTTSSTEKLIRKFLDSQKRMENALDAASTCITTMNYQLEGRFETLKQDILEAENRMNTKHEELQKTMASLVTILGPLFPRVGVSSFDDKITASSEEGMLKWYRVS